MRVGDRQPDVISDNLHFVAPTELDFHPRVVASFGTLASRLWSGHQVVRPSSLLRIRNTIT